MNEDYYKITKRALELVELDRDGAMKNPESAEETLAKELGLTAYRARVVVVQAARRQRYTKLPDEIRWLTPTTAADEFGGSASNIRRACAFGFIDAQQNSAGRWSFTVASFKRWKEDGKHKPGKEGMNG